MSPAEQTRESLPDFSNPPVIEVVYGVRFTPPKGWTIPHIGAFWQRVASDFPRCEHARPIVDEEDLSNSGTAWPLPRVWLITTTDDQLIQMQPGRFMFNWRLREESGPYPRYEVLSKRFFALFREFNAYLQEVGFDPISPAEFELTYINHIPSEGKWQFPAHVGRVVKQLNWHKDEHTFLPEPTNVSWQAHFDLTKSDDGVLIAKLAPAERRKDNVSLLTLNLSARTTSPPKVESMEAWFAQAREWIVRGFTDLTTDESHKEWGKLND